MDVIKIGKFIAKNRKDKKLTQEQLAEKLGVTAKTISRWENGNYMPDISMLKPLSDELGVTLNDLISGEKVDKEHYQEKLEENIINTIDFTSKKVNEKNKSIAKILLLFGLGLIFVAFTIFPTESSWNSIFSILGVIISLIGFSELHKGKPYTNRLLLNLGYFVVVMSLLLVIDYTNVKLNSVPPRFSYIIETGDNMIIYKSPLCNVYRINRNTRNEYYIIDTKKLYNENTVPVSPFNRTKSGIDNIIQYKNQYIGNNSNIGNLLGNLPLSEYGYVFKIDSENLGLTVDYHITDWYISDTQYLEKSLIYNSVSIFALIDNVNQITFNFTEKSYVVNRKQIEEYPNYSKILENGINKENFNVYLENKMNDYEFINSTFEKIFKN